MVIRPRHPARRRAMVMIEIMVAMSILILVMVPLGYAFFSDARLFRATYQRAVAMEIVDGEIEILAAGHWRDIPEGARPYEVHANALTNLPPGRFVLTRDGNHLRLEWSSDKKVGVGEIVREVTVK
jgi:Tfp pilus assembly protein PilW